MQVSCNDRLFSQARRSGNGASTPSWLMTPGPVLMRRHVKNSKYEPMVENVTLLEGNPQYAHIKFPDGKETTVSTRYLAPSGQPALIDESRTNADILLDTEIMDHTPEHEDQSNPVQPVSEIYNQSRIENDLPSRSRDSMPPIRQGSRVRRPPSYFSEYKLY